jgi:hypothetical protein
MKTGAVQSLIVGMASLLALPGVAAGQIDAGKTVGEVVEQVGQAVPQAAPQAPVQFPAAPVQPPAPAAPAPRQAPLSAPAAPAPSPSGGGSTGTAASGTTSGGGGASGATASPGKGGTSKAGAGKARASSRKGADRGIVLAAQEDQPLTPPEGQSFSGAVTTNPDTGVVGDPELPFTGFQALLLLAMGAAALAAGVAFRTAARRRHVG